jgi:hypothetical protein
LSARTRPDTGQLLPVTSLAVIPLLWHIAEATGARKDLIVLAAALRKVDPGEAETLLRRAYDQATTGGEYQLASTTAGELITLLRDQSRLREALTLAGPSATSTPTRARSRRSTITSPITCPASPGSPPRNAPTASPHRSSTTSPATRVNSPGRSGC